MQPYLLDQAVEIQINGFWVPAYIKAVHPTPTGTFAYTVQPDLTNFVGIGPSGPFSYISSNLLRLPQAPFAITDTQLIDYITPTTVNPAETVQTAAQAGSPDDIAANVSDDPSLLGSPGDPIASIS